MASVSKTFQPLSRSRSLAFPGISRIFGDFCSSVNLRSYSDDSLDGSLPEKPVDAINTKDDSTEASSTSDVPSTSPIAAETLGSITVPNSGPYPPRNYRTPRGVYKVTLLGEVGQLPIQKVLKSGRSVTIFSVGTGGMYNNRRPFQGESPEQYADRSYTQWHRVAVYHDRVAGFVMQNMKIGSQVYLEGNIETRVYNDPNSGIVKRIREVAIRTNGRLMFMEATSSSPKGGSTVPKGQPSPTDDTSAQSSAEQELPPISVS